MATSAVSSPSFSIRPGNDPALIAGQFQILGPLESSLTGRSYLGRHVELDRPVVIKLMHVSGAASVRARFEREARALARISNQHVARLLAYGKTEDNRRYMVVEHVEGQTLRRTLARWGRLPEQRVLRILEQVAQALESVHRAGLVHRNLKPESILLGETREGGDMVKLTNFGLVRDAWPAAGDKLGEGATSTKAMTGTPRYWAPEQVLGDTTDARTDIYAFGVIAFEMLTGKNPFESTTAEGYAWQHVHQLPLMTDRQGRPRLRAELEALIGRCLAKHPDQRFPSTAELRVALRATRESMLRQTHRASRRTTHVADIKATMRRPEVWVMGGIAFLSGLLGALLG